MNGRDSVFRPTGRPLTLPTRPCRCIINAHKDYVNNTLVINVLHASAVGAGFIPVLPATDKIQSKYHAAARMGINPTPTGRVLQAS